MNNEEYRGTLIDALNRHIDYLYYEKIPSLRNDSHKSYYNKELKNAQDLKALLETGEQPIIREYVPDPRHFESERDYLVALDAWRRWSREMMK